MGKRICRECHSRAYAFDADGYCSARCAHYGKTLGGHAKRTIYYEALLRRCRDFLKAGALNPTEDPRKLLAELNAALGDNDGGDP